MNREEFKDKFLNILSDFNIKDKDLFDFITENMPDYCKIEIKKNKNYTKLLETLMLNSKTYSIIKPKKRRDKKFKKYEFYIDKNKKININVLYI